MEIIIPSHKRPHLQVTYQQFPPEIQDRIRIAVYADETEEYAGYARKVVPSQPKGIGHKRQFLVDNVYEKAFMLDDDLVFATRRQDDPTKFKPADHFDMEVMTMTVQKLLDTFAHGAIAGREGGNRRTEPLIGCTRAMRAHFYRADILRYEGIRFDRIPFMEDFDVTLQLLRKGYPNVLLNTYVNNQSGSQAAGGCSEYRTMEKHAEAAHMLKELHPDFVTVVHKRTKADGEWGDRTDVRIQWKQAYLSSGNTDLLDTRKVANFRPQAAGTGSSVE